MTTQETIAAIQKTLDEVGLHAFVASDAQMPIIAKAIVEIEIAFDPRELEKVTDLKQFVLNRIYSVLDRISDDDCSCDDCS